MKQLSKHAANLGRRLYEHGLHAVIVACGGAIWAFFGLQGLLGWQGWKPYAILSPIPLLLILAGLTLRHRSATLPQESSRWQQQRSGYVQVVRLEYLAILAVIVIGSALQHSEYLMPIIAIIVGVHFFALVRILPPISAAIKGALLTLVGLLTLTLLPQHIEAAAPIAHSLMLWALVPGLAIAAVLWFDGVTASISGFRLLQRATTVAA